MRTHLGPILRYLEIQRGDGAEIEIFSKQNSNCDRQSTARGLRYVSHAPILTPPFWIRDGLEVQQHTVIEREEVQQLIVAWILGW